MGSAGEAAAMEAATHQESGQGSLLNKVYAMQCAQQQQQQQSTVLTVVGGRMISRSAPMPLNGQQLMMQLDGLTSAMTGMSVQEEAMESTEEEDDSPYSQTCRRRDPVYLASMAAHALPTSQEMERHHLEQLQQQQEQQQRLEQQQLEYQLQLMQLQQQHHQQQQQQQQQQESCPAMSDHQVPDMETSSLSMSLPIDSDFHYGSGRVLKRPDLLPMGNFF